MPAAPDSPKTRPRAPMQLGYPMLGLLWTLVAGALLMWSASVPVVAASSLVGLGTALLLASRNGRRRTPWFAA